MTKDQTNKTIWIPGYEGHYELVDGGLTVISHGAGKPKQKKWSTHRQGYPMMNLSLPSKEGKRIQKLLLQHQGVWVWHNGPIPEGMVIDHIDGSPTNNNIENLRLCKRAENMRNMKKRVDNNSGLPGVCWHKQLKKWVARITVDTKIFHLGCYRDKFEAFEAVEKKRRELHKEFAKEHYIDCSLPGAMQYLVKKLKQIEIQKN